jgi:hypothetical protein
MHGTILGLIEALEATALNVSSRLLWGISTSSASSTAERCIVRLSNISLRDAHPMISAVLLNEIALSHVIVTVCGCICIILICNSGYLDLLVRV